MGIGVSSGTQNALPVAGAHAVLWRRAGVLAVDLLVLSLATLLARAVFGTTTVTSGTPGTDFGQYTTTSMLGWGWSWLSWLVYFIALEALFGATLGKYLLGLRVTTLAGRRPTVRQVLVRNLARLVDGLPVLYLVGACAVWLSPTRQRVGDRIARTLVVPHETLAAPLLPPAAVLRRLALVSGVLVALGAFTGAFWYFGRPPLVIQGMINTQQAMFRDGTHSYTLSPPTWGNDTVNYQITYHTLSPADTCHATLVLTWTPLGGWVFAHGQASCLHHTP